MNNNNTKKEKKNLAAGVASKVVQKNNITAKKMRSALSNRVSPSGKSAYEKTAAYKANPASKPKWNKPASVQIGDTTIHYNEPHLNMGKQYSEMNTGEKVAYLRLTHAPDSAYEQLALDIDNPSSKDFNPYWSGRSTQTAAMSFFTDYLGTPDVRFDQQFFDDNIGLRQYAKRSPTTGNLLTPSASDPQEVWAAYYYESMLADKQYSDNANEQYAQYRNNAQTWFADYITINGHPPTLEEFMAADDITNYPVLYSMDASRNIGSDKSSKVVQLNNGCNYSSEGRIGMYYVLVNGGDLTEDRSYFEDAVQYYMSPVENNSYSTPLEEMGYDVSSWGDIDYDNAMRDARNSGDHVAYETLKYYRWKNGEHMDSVDTTDYLGAEFGYYKDDEYFRRIEERFAPIWAEMYTDETQTSIKKPNSSDPLEYHRAYAAWQDMQLKDITDRVEKQSELVYSEIDDMKIEGRTEEEAIDFVNRMILSDPAYADVVKYMAGDVKTAREIFISNDEIAARVAKRFETGAEENVIVDEGSEVPYGYYEVMFRMASATAAQFRDGVKDLSSSLIALSDSAVNISTAQIDELGISVMPSEIIENSGLSAMIAGMWHEFMSLSRGTEYNGEITTEALALDPVLKALATSAGIKNGAVDVPVPTLGMVASMLETNTESHMRGGIVSWLDGVIDAVLPYSNQFYSAFERLSDKMGYTNKLNDMPVDANTFNDVYERSIDLGYDEESSADAALVASFAISPSLKSMIKGTEDDEELNALVKGLADGIVNSEGYIDSLALVTPIVSEVYTSENIDEDSAKAFTSGVLVGVSEYATPEHAAVTKELLNEVSNGNYKIEDIETAINSMNMPIDGVPKNKNLGFFDVGTEEYDKLDDETKAQIDEVCTQGILEYVEDPGEIKRGIVTVAAKYGHGDNYGTGESKAYSNRFESIIGNTDVIVWADSVFGVSDEIYRKKAVVNGVGSYDNTFREQAMVTQKLQTYGRYFTYDEQKTLFDAWASGFISYEGFEEVLNNRVSQFSGYSVNAMHNPEALADGVSAARSFINSVREVNDQNYEISNNAPSYKVLREVENANELIRRGQEPLIVVEANPELQEIIGYDQLKNEYTDRDELSDVVIEKLFNVSKGAVYVDTPAALSGSEYTNPQLHMLGKYVGLYEDFGYLGRDFVETASPEDLKKYGIDFEAVGLTKSPMFYMDDITNGTWRDAYENAGLGAVGTINAGLLKGFQGVGNLPANGVRFVRDVLDFLPGISEVQKGDGSYYDRVSGVSVMNDENVRMKATSGEGIAVLVVSEFTRNQIVGLLGATLGKAYAAGVGSSTIGNMLSGSASYSPAVNVDGVLSVANKAIRTAKEMSAVTTVARLPFAGSVFLNTYNYNRDNGKGIANAFIRSVMETCVELFTETPEVEGKLNRMADWIMPGVKRVPSGLMASVYRVGRTVYNEVGQEELALMFNTVFDVVEGASKIRAGSPEEFFVEFGKVVSSATEGKWKEAGETALVTSFITVLGGVTNLGANSATMAQVNEWHLSGREMDGETYKNIMRNGMNEIVEHFSKRTDAGEAVEPDAANDNSTSNKGESNATGSVYDPATQTPVFNRRRTDSEAVSASSDSTSEDATVENESTPNQEERIDGIVKAAMKGEITEEEAVSAIEEELERGSEEVVPEDYPETASDESMQPQQSVSPGVQKIAEYINNSTEATANAVANIASDRTIDEAVENDPAVASAQKKIDVAEEKLAKAEEEVRVIAEAVDKKKQQLGMVYAAAVNEGVALNATSVQNAVIANQQETAALENDLSNQQKVVSEASGEVAKAEEEHKEAVEQARKKALPVAKKHAEKIKAKYVLVPRKEIVGDKSEEAVYETEDDIAERERRKTASAAVAEAEQWRKDAIAFISGMQNGYAPKYNTDMPRFTFTGPGAQGRRSFEQYMNSVRGYVEENKSRENIYGGDDLLEEEYREQVAVEMAESRPENTDENASSNATDAYDYETDLGLRTGNIVDAFNGIIKVSANGNWTDFVQVTKGEHDELRAALSKNPDAQSILLRSAANTDENADIRPSKRSVDKTKNRAIEMSSSDYMVLTDTFKLTPYAESDDEIILQAASNYRAEDTPEIVRLVEAQKDARNALADFTFRDNALRRCLPLAPRDTVKSIQERIRKYNNLIPETRKFVLTIGERINELRSQNGSYNKGDYLVFNKADMRAVIRNIDLQRAKGDNYTVSRANELIERQYYGMSSEKLRGMLLEKTDISGLDPKSRSLVFENINKMSDAEMIGELLQITIDETQSSIANAVKTMPVKKYTTQKDIKKHIESNEKLGHEYNQLAVEKSYYVHSSLHAICSMYKKATNKSDESDMTYTEKAMLQISPDGIAPFISKLTELSSASHTATSREVMNDALGIVESPHAEEGYKYLPVDFSEQGVLYVNDNTRKRAEGSIHVNAPKVYNAPLTDKWGNYNVYRAFTETKRGLGELAANPSDSKYDIRVAMRIDGNRVIRTVGSLYNGEVYMPTYHECMQKGNQIFVRHTKVSRAGNEYVDLDYVILARDQRTDWEVKNHLREAERAFNSLFMDKENAPRSELTAYAETYLSWKLKDLRHSITRTVRDYNMNGARYGKDHNKKLSEEIAAMRKEANQISVILEETRKARENANTNAPVAIRGKHDYAEVIDDLRNKLGPESPEVAAAVAIAKDSGTGSQVPKVELVEDTASKREIALKVDAKLTEGMNAEEKGDYYAERAVDAYRDGDSYRYDLYNRQVYEAAVEVGYIDGVEMAEEELPPSEGMEELDETYDSSEEARAAARRPHEAFEYQGEIDGVEMAEPDAPVVAGIEEDSEEDIYARVYRAMEEYEIGEDAERRIDLKYPGRNDNNDEEADGPYELKEVYDGPIDENTRIDGFGADWRFIPAGREIVRSQKRFIDGINREIDSLKTPERLEWENGAKRWKERYDRRMRFQNERDHKIVGSDDYKALGHRINGLYTEEMNDQEGGESYRRWSDYHSRIEELKDKRRIARENYRHNLREINGSRIAAELAHGVVRYRPHDRIPGSKGNKTGIEIAREIRKELGGGLFLKYDKKTLVKIEDVARVISDKLDPSFYANASEDAKNITAGRKEVEMEIADLRYSLAIINSKAGHGSLDEAKGEYVEAYVDSIRRSDFTESGYNNYKEELRFAREKALESAKEIEDLYNEWSKEDVPLDSEHADLTRRIEDLNKILENMRSIEASTYALGNGDIVGALRGDYGAIPVPLMNILNGMVLDANSTKRGTNIIGNFTDSHKRIFEDYLGEYAPIMKAVFVDPVLHAGDIVRNEITERLDKLKKAIPNKKIDVVVEIDGNAVEKKMPLREIVGHIIDERINEEYKDIPDSRYVQHRLAGYGITDAGARKMVSDAVDYARNFNDELYTEVNEALVKSGHHAQAFDYRKWYMHHYNNDGDIKLLGMLGIHTSDDIISEAVVDDTATRRPSHQYMSAAQQRHGTHTEYDFVESVTRSIDSAMNAIYQTKNIDRLKQLEIAMNGVPKVDENGKTVMEGGKIVLAERPLYEVNADGIVVDKNRIQSFANVAGRFAQRAANKRTGAVDRAVVKYTSRKAFGVLRFMTSLKSFQSVAFNPMSAVTNFAPVKFLVGICTPSEIASAAASTVSQLTGKAESLDYVAEHSQFLKGRIAHSSEERSISGSLADAAYGMSAFTDKITANFMVRALFNHEVNTNNSEESDMELALRQAEEMARDMLTDKSPVGRSEFYDNLSLGGIFGQFQQEAVNELMYMVKDMRYYGGGKIPKWLIGLAITFMFNAMYNYARNSNSLSDPLGEGFKAYNNLTGEESKYDAAKAVFGAAIKQFAPIDYLVTGEVPIVETFKDVVDAFDGLFSGEENIWGFTSDLAFTLFPGGGTIKRGIRGVKTVERGYAESDSGNIKYLTGEPSIGKYILAAIGGEGLLPGAREYNYRTKKGLGKDQSAKFKELIAGGLDEATAWRFVRNPKAATKEEQYAVENAEANAIDLTKIEHVFEDEAMQSDYEVIADLKIKAYNRGEYGEVGSPSALRKLKEELDGAQNRVEKIYKDEASEAEEVK